MCNSREQHVCVIITVCDLQHMTLVTHRCTSTLVCVATQTRDVVVYRLVTCGTVEEKIYRKQVFKGGLSRAGMEDGVQLRCGLWPPASLVINPEPCILYIFYITVYHYI